MDAERNAGPQPQDHEAASAGRFSVQPHWYKTTEAAEWKVVEFARSSHESELLLRLPVRDNDGLLAVRMKGQMGSGRWSGNSAEVALVPSLEVRLELSDHRSDPARRSGLR